MIEKKIFTKENYEKLKEEQENLKQRTLETLNKLDKGNISAKKTEKYKKFYLKCIAKNDALIELCKQHLAK